MEGDNPGRSPLAPGLGRGVGKQVGLPRVQGSGSGTQQGLGPEGPAAGGARGPCLGAEPNSIPQQPHARRRPVSNSSPGVTGSWGGARALPHPALPFRAHLAAPPSGIRSPSLH